jgi:Histidine kinase-, DNA gyrase B-, and HSP90-like ATPase
MLPPAREHGSLAVSETLMPPTAQWLIVLRADGVVDSVEGGAPAAWLGRALVEAPDAAGALRQAATELVHAPSGSCVRRRKVRCTDGDAKVDVDVVLVEALPLRRARTPLHELVMRTLDLFATQAKSSSVDLTIDQAKGVPAFLDMDREKIAWALSTLVANALRYARSHVGVHVRWEEWASELVLEVADDGPGMPESQTRWLFERNPASGQSAGLALVLVRDVIVAHRGSISVQSHVGRGTTFTMRIPGVRNG